MAQLKTEVCNDNVQLMGWGEEFVQSSDNPSKLKCGYSQLQEWSQEMGIANDRERTPRIHDNSGRRDVAEATSQPTGHSHQMETGEIITAAVLCLALNIYQYVDRTMGYSSRRIATALTES
jgi:hypothetical protein